MKAYLVPLLLLPLAGPAIGQQSAPDTLDSKATGLKPGAYRIRWQVLAPDGHITRGEVPFSVAAS